MHLKVVVFPAPFNPSNPKHSPGSTQKFKFFIATIFLLFFLQHEQQYPNSFLIFFNLKEYFDILLSLFPSLIDISSALAFSISSKTRLSLTFCSILLLLRIIYLYEANSIINRIKVYTIISASKYTIKANKKIKCLIISLSSNSIHSLGYSII